MTNPFGLLEHNFFKHRKTDLTQSLKEMALHWRPKHHSVCLFIYMQRRRLSVKWRLGNNLALPLPEAPFHPFHGAYILFTVNIGLMGVTSESDRSIRLLI